MYRDLWSATWGTAGRIRFNGADRKLERPGRARVDSNTERTNSMSASGGIPGEPTGVGRSLRPPPWAREGFIQMQRDKHTIRVTKGYAV